MKEQEKNQNKGKNKWNLGQKKDLYVFTTKC
jgi:hypothetical protein